MIRCGDFQPVVLAFQLAVWAVGAGKSTAALGKNGGRDFSPDIRLPIYEIISGKSLTVQILDQGGRNGMVVSIFPEGASGTE